MHSWWKLCLQPGSRRVESPALNPEMQIAQSSPHKSGCGPARASFSFGSAAISIGRSPYAIPASPAAWWIPASPSSRPPRRLIRPQRRKDSSVSIERRARSAR